MSRRVNSSRPYSARARSWRQRPLNAVVGFRAGPGAATIFFAVLSATFNAEAAVYRIDGTGTIDSTLMSPASSNWSARIPRPAERSLGGVQNGESPSAARA